MEKRRKNQIALLVLRYKLRREGLFFETNLGERIVGAAKEMKIPSGEALEFAEVIYQELLNHALGTNNYVPKMDEGRMGEIAYLYLQWIGRKDGVRLKADLRRSAGTTAKDIGISTDEMVDFIKALIKDAFEL
ncbi:MAG: hypothetical protein WC998_02520 [Candidatus Paceibacterota bacterium]|jgi:hypothetical protein